MSLFVAALSLSSHPTVRRNVVYIPLVSEIQRKNGLHALDQRPLPPLPGRNTCVASDDALSGCKSARMEEEAEEMRPSRTADAMSGDTALKEHEEDEKAAEEQPGA